MKVLGWPSDEVTIYQKQYTAPAYRELEPVQQIMGIKALLIRLHIITGVHLPTDEALLNVLQSELGKALEENPKYNSLNFEEIEHAFRMNAAGNLGERVKHWNNTLNLEYFGQVVERYMEKREEVRHKVIYLELPKRVNTDAGILDWRQSAEICYQEFLTGKYNLQLWPWQVYDEVVTVGWMEAAAWMDYVKAATKLITDRMNGEKVAAEIAGQAGLVSELEKKIAAISAPQIQEKIIYTAKLLAVEKLFGLAKAREYKNLFKPCE